MSRSQQGSQHKLRLRKLDMYSVIVTLVVVAVLSIAALAFAEWHAGSTSNSSPPTVLPAICNCPNITTETNADACACH